MKTIEGRVAVITGGASGIGRCVALEFARAGAHIAIADIDDAGLESTGSELRALGVRVSTHRIDVSKREEIERLRDEVLDAHGSVQILINNAGITLYGSIEQSKPEAIERQLGINLMGVIYGVQTFLPLLKQQEESHIVNVSSMAAIAGIPMQSIYCASKAAVRAFSESLSAEMAGTNVGVTWLMPGAIRTTLLDKAGDENLEVTQKLSSLLKKYAYRPETVAKHLLKHVRGKGGELRVTIECEALYTMNRAAPSLVRASMRSAQRLANRFEKA